jgi:hypothetical protein
MTDRKRPTDRERMDWLTKGTHTLEPEYPEGWSASFQLTWNAHRDGFFGPTPRAAIDSAMAAEKKEKRRAKG